MSTSTRHNSILASHPLPSRPSRFKRQARGLPPVNVGDSWNERLHQLTNTMAATGWLSFIGAGLYVFFHFFVLGLWIEWALTKVRSLLPHEPSTSHRQSGDSILSFGELVKATLNPLMLCSYCVDAIAILLVRRHLRK